MPEIRPAAGNETIEALQCLFQYAPPDEALTRVRKTAGLLHMSGPEQPSLLVAVQTGAICGAILLQALVGRTGLLWPPQVRDSATDGERIADQLTAVGISMLRDRGAKVIQSVMVPEEERLAAPFVRGGFSQPTRLMYLRHDLELGPDQLCAPEQLTFVDYRHASREVFHRILMRSYEQTLDFPELNGRRSIDDILAGLQVSGYDPQRWFLAANWRGAIGVLILSEVEADAWEISYVGVAPEARRKGWGRELVRKGLFEAKAAGAHELILSVDERNIPALQLYRAAGFQEYDRRAVYLLLE